MNAVGFVKSAQVGVDVLALEGIQLKGRKAQEALPKVQLALLEERLAEVEAELAVMDAAPSVPAAVRNLRSSGCTLSEMRSALSTALTCVSNILRNPKVVSPFHCLPLCLLISIHCKYITSMCLQ